MGVYEDDSGNQHVSIQLSWTAASPADLDLSEYVAAWSQDNSDWQEMSVERTATSCRIFGLELGEGYYFRIKAVDRAGNESAWVNFNAGAIITMPSDVTAPDNPTGLTTYSRFKSVYLAWTNPVQKDLSHIEVWRNAAATFVGATKITEIDGTSYTDEIGLWDSTFYYALRAVDKVGNTSAGTAWVSGNTDITAPAAPTGLSTSTGTVIDADGHIIPYIDCAWTDSVTEDVQAHEVEVQYDDNGGWWDPLTFRCQGTPLRLTPVPGDVKYRVQVRALDDAQLPSAWTAYHPAAPGYGTTAKDNVAPAVPANLSVEPAWGAIVITVDVPSEYDWGLTEFHVSTTSPFTPSGATLVHAGKINRHNHPCNLYITYYVKVRHRDTSGNWSNYCAQGSAKPLLAGQYCDIVTSNQSASNVIFVHVGITAEIESSFVAPSAFVTGLAYDGANLISTDEGSNKIYKHSGITSTITLSFNAPGGDDSDGLTFDPVGGDLISCDRGVPRKIYHHSGISATITTSFNAPNTLPSGLTFDGENLISCDRGQDVIYIHSGITSTITKTFDTPASVPQGLTYDPYMNDLLSIDSTADKVYVHSGVTDTIRNEFTITGLLGGIVLVLR